LTIASLRARANREAKFCKPRFARSLSETLHPVPSDAMADLLSVTEAAAAPRRSLRSPVPSKKRVLDAHDQPTREQVLTRSKTLLEWRSLYPRAKAMPMLALLDEAEKAEDDVRARPRLRSRSRPAPTPRRRREPLRPRGRAQTAARAPPPQDDDYTPAGEEESEVEEEFDEEGVVAERGVLAPDPTDAFDPQSFSPDEALLDALEAAEEEEEEEEDAAFEPAEDESEVEEEFEEDEVEEENDDDDESDDDESDDDEPAVA
jgi:hypothetical protein